MIDGEIMQVEPENLVTEVLMLKHLCGKSGGQDRNNLFLR